MLHKLTEAVKVVHVISEELLTVDEVAGLLRISPSSLYNLRYAREAPPAIRVGSRLRWRRADVEAWIESRAESSTRRSR